MAPTEVGNARVVVTPDGPSAAPTARSSHGERRHPAVTPPVLVATDGQRGADAALRVGTALARREGGEPTVVSVYQPLPAFDPALSPRLPEVDRALERELALAVGQQGERTRVGLAASRCDVVAGPVPDTIAREAAMRGAGLIVLGIGRHGAREVVTGRETALGVIRIAPVPVLAVAPSEVSPPRRIVVALDFAASSERALRAAARLLGPRGALFLVHVLPRAGRFVAAAWEAAQRREASLALENAAAGLAAPDGVRVERAVLVGDPAQELLDFADSVDANVVATGSHGYSGVTRALLGSVSTQVLRRARCSVLVAPPGRGER